MAARHALDNRVSLPATAGQDRWPLKNESSGQNSAYGLLAVLINAAPGKLQGAVFSVLCARGGEYQ